MSDGGEWVWVTLPGGAGRRDWVPTEQPSTPDGTLGLWHVVVDGPEPRWEWHPAPAGWSARPRTQVIRPLAAAAGVIALLATAGTFVVNLASSESPELAASTSPEAALVESCQRAVRSKVAAKAGGTVVEFASAAVTPFGRTGEAFIGRKGWAVNGDLSTRGDNGVATSSGYTCNLFETPMTGTFDVNASVYDRAEQAEKEREIWETAGPAVARALGVRKIRAPATDPCIRIETEQIWIPYEYYMAWNREWVAAGGVEMDLQGYMRWLPGAHPDWRDTSAECLRYDDAATVPAP